MKKTLIIGGGFCGVAAAVQARIANPSCRILLLEKADRLIPWIDRKGLRSYPLGNLREVEYPDDSRREIWLCQKHCLQKWPNRSTRDWFRELGIQLVESDEGSLVCDNLQKLRNTFNEVLEKSAVEVRFDYSLESVSVQPDGTFRIWSKDGEAEQGSRLILATGGERNHGLKIARDLGAEVETPIPAFVRLKLASPKLGNGMGPLEQNVRVRCLKSNAETKGMMKISSRGLEGIAISNLTAMQSALWNKLGYKLQIEVDWLPDQASTSILKELSSKVERGGKRNVVDTPMFSFPEKSWKCLLKSARIDQETTWPRLKNKKLQALANRLKADRISVSGMGLPEIERAWSGGVVLQSVNQQTFESLKTPGLFFAGEILNMHGFPSGEHQNLIWAIAHAVGKGISD